MSVTRTIYHDENVAAAENLRDATIHITLTGVDYWINAGRNELELAIPLSVWAVMRRHTSEDEGKVIDRSDG